MQPSFVFHNAQIVAPTGVQLGWVAVRGPMIVGMGTGNPPAADRMIDADGKFLLPGRIDPHVHIGVYMPFEDDLRVTSRSAAAGGTTLMMPLNRARGSYFGHMPSWKGAIERSSVIDVMLQLQIQERIHIDEIHKYHEAFGTSVFKLHLDYRAPVGDLDIAPLDDGDVFLTMRSVAPFDGIVAVHCENVEVERYLIDEAREARVSDLRGWSGARPPFCEISDLHTIGYLSQVTGCRALVVHLSTPEGVEAARLWRNPALTLETLVHFLTMNYDEAQERVGPSLGKMNPPLRSAEESEGLWTALRNGEIATIGTDHVLCDKDPSTPLWEAHTSAPEIEYALPLLLTKGVYEHRISLDRLVDAMSRSPASLYGIDATKGSIAIGKDADLVLVDMETPRRVPLRSAISSYPTSVAGMELRGWPRITMVRGTIVFEEGEFSPLASGMLVAPAST